MTDQSDLDLLLHEPFEDPEPAATRPEPVAGEPKVRGQRPRRLTVVVVVAVLVLAAGGGIWAATGSSAASYRSATVRMGDVDQTLNSYGTVQPINQAVVAFPVGGTVATVPVTVGEHVKVGQTLATIDKTSLQSQLDSAQSTLATAQAKLASDTQAQADGTTVSSNTGGSGSSSSLGPADVAAAVPLAAGPPEADPAGRRVVRVRLVVQTPPRCRLPSPMPRPSCSTINRRSTQPSTASARS